MADFTGKRFGLLTVIGLSDTRRSPNGTRHRCWLCRCDCGTEKPVRGQALKAGKTISCGCAKRLRLLTHGMEDTPEYKVWCTMKSRCQRKTDPSYPNYGGRGISVCERWQSFENFISDMGRRPPGRLTIERDDNNKGYSPDNCRWATYAEQSKNQRKTGRNTSGFVGVSRDKKNWVAYIKIDGKKRHIGNFHTAEEAAVARRAVAAQHGFKTDIGDT